MSKRVLILALAGGALAASGCGSSSNSTSTKAAPAAPAPASTGTSGASSSVAIAADPSGQLAFVPKSASAKSGKTTLKFTNAAPVPHNLTLADSSGKEVASTATFSGGGTRSLSVTLQPGTYTYYCTVPGHRAAGMQGTLTVN